MKISVTMLSFSDYIKSSQMSVKDFIELMSGYDVEAVDLLEYYWKDKEAEIGEVPRWLKSAGLELGAFCIGNNFLVEPEERSGQIERVMDGIRTAARLEASRLRVFGGHWTNKEGIRAVPTDVNRDEWLEVIIECLDKCTHYAKQNNVVMAIENHNHLPITIEETLKVVKAVNSPYLQLNFDIGNFKTSAGEDPVKAAEVLYEYVAHIHAKDAVASTTPGKKHECCPLGEGFVPLKDALRVFKRKNYDGYVSIEYEGWKRMESKSAVKKSVEYLRKVFSEI